MNALDRVLQTFSAVQSRGSAAHLVSRKEIVGTGTRAAVKLIEQARKERQ
jgi:hypothetical protein